MWVSHENFRDVVEEAWNVPGVSMGFFGLATKLKKIKVVLKEWNRWVFGRTELNIQALETQIDHLESQLQGGFSEDIELELLVAKEQLDLWIRREETRLSQQTSGWDVPIDIHLGAVDFFMAFLQARQHRDLSDLSSGRGLRQGDLLSPYLFILVEETLSCLLKHNFATGKIVPFSHLRGTPLISHLLYADDIVVFTNGGRSSLKAIRDVFALYEDWSGQMYLGVPLLLIG
ncbi:hypothetical protein F2P56_026814 [Juglans regia]|uniref:Reverse transcriptase domain-containing protein n=1 Tax=Juglans regia TaxID=51240 RepID=A0A833WYS2_JUGRE|nr:hypothetical protein F2P56_026814 [Juglans regia]